MSTTFNDGFRNQLRVLGALLLRELHTRYGRENIGYLWVVGEPLTFASVITLIHLAQPSTHYSNDIDPAAFAIIGYTIFIIFRGVFNRAEGAIEQGQPLLYHRMVTVFDVLVSRSFLDIIGCCITMVLLLTLAISFGLSSLPARPLYLMSAAALMAWWSFALALIAASLTYGRETLGRQLHVVSYFSIPISGAYFQMYWLPQSFQNVLRWFPMPLIFEQARYGQFRAAPSNYVDPLYVSAWCAVLTYLGLLLVRRARSKVHG